MCITNELLLCHDVDNINMLSQHVNMLSTMLIISSDVIIMCIIMLNY